MAHAVTFPFFKEQVQFAEQDINRKAKYLLFFVTKVIELRDDGMEISVIADRLRDRSGHALTNTEQVGLQSFFKAGGDDGEIVSAPRSDGTVAFKINATKVDKLFGELQKGQRVFISYKREFETGALAIEETLRSIGINPWLDLRDITHGEITRKIHDGINDSCLIVFLITPNFQDKQWIQLEIDYALHRRTEHHNRFNILSIVIRSGNTIPEVPELLRDSGIYKEVRANRNLIDHNIIKYIVNAMPIRLGMTEWLNSDS